MSYLSSISGATEQKINRTCETQKDKLIPWVHMPGYLVTRWGNSRLLTDPLLGAMAEDFLFCCSVFAYTLKLSVALRYLICLLKDRLTCTIWLQFGHFISMMPVVAVTLSKMRQLQLGHLFDILIPSFPIVFTSNHMPHQRANTDYPDNHPLVIRDISCGLPMPF